MNVLYVVNSINLYGANKSLLDFIEYMPEHYVRPVVLLWGYGAMYTECIKRNIKVYVLPYTLNTHKEKTLNIWDKIYKFEKNIALFSVAKKIIKENHIDLIHSNASNVDFGAMLAVACRLPHIWHIRELLCEDYSLYYDAPWLVHLLMHKSDKIIAISDYVACQRKLPAGRIVLYDGLDVDNYVICKDELFHEPRIRILYAGIISYNKGTLDIVRAVKQLVCSGYTNVLLMIAGGESEYWYKLKQYIVKNRLESYIEYYGYQSDLKPYREKADIAVVSSKSEALGRVTIESMLSEVLVIGANGGAMPELIQDSVTGYLYEPGNSGQLVNKILEAYRDVEKSKSIVKEAKKYAIENFGIQQYIYKILKVYEDCGRH